MSTELIERRTFGAYTLLRSIRREGPFELFEVVTMNDAARDRLALRAAHRELADRPAIRRALQEGAEVAKRVAHQNVLLCQGTIEDEGRVAQLFEHAHDLDLESLLESQRSTNAPLDPRLAVWIARQIAEALAHAESLGYLHQNLAPRHVHAASDGAIKIDYGLSLPPDSSVEATAVGAFGSTAYAPPIRASAGEALHPDVYAAAAILFELTTGARYADTLRARGVAAIGARALVRELPASLDLILARALDPKRTDRFQNAAAFGAALERLFYADLDADDELHGRAALLTWSRERELVRPSDLGTVDPSEVTDPSAAPRKGTFTKMLEELGAPVVPKELSLDDRDSEVVSRSGWTPEVAGAEPDTVAELVELPEATTSPGTASARTGPTAPGPLAAPSARTVPNTPASAGGLIAATAPLIPLPSSAPGTAPILDPASTDPAIRARRFTWHWPWFFGGLALAIAGITAFRLISHALAGPEIDRGAVVPAVLPGEPRKSVDGSPTRQ